MSSPAKTEADRVRAIIASKYLLMEQITARITALQAQINVAQLPTDYNIDGKAVARSSAFDRMMDRLLDAQEREEKVIARLRASLQNIDPYFFANSAF